MPAFLRRHWAALLWPAFAVATIAFYSLPLFSRNATIHWDLGDITYPAQKFLSDSLHSWKLPQWTPYLESGIPFLADPGTGAWYPLHWPFFLISIWPRTLFAEIALHSFLALGGTYLLARRLFGAPGPAVLAGLFYAWGAYFAAHATLLAGFECAALLPWLLWGALLALENSGSRWIAFTSLILGLMALAGDYAAAVESFCVLVLFVAATRKWQRGVTLLATAVVLALMLGGVQILPAMVLHSQSHPAASAARFAFRELATLVAGDYYNMISGLYVGPEDPRQYYLYSGLLLIPLAIAGFVRRERWLLLLAILVPTVIFETARRPPGDAWFPAALALALAAGAGALWVEQRMERPHLWAVFVLLTVIDLWFWNVYRNPLTFARATFVDVYGETRNLSQKDPLGRTWAHYLPVGYGPEDGSLITRSEVTYGGGVAPLDRYAAYLSAVEKNAKLLNGLAATRLVFGRNQELDNPNALPRATVPPRVEFVADRTAALAALSTLDPATATIVEAPARTLAQDVRSVAITGYTGDSYRIRYSAGAESLIRVAFPYYPGWTASVDGRPAQAYPADEALMAVLVPAGNHELLLRFDPPQFGLGLSLTVAAGIALAIGLILT